MDDTKYENGDIRRRNGKMIGRMFSGENMFQNRYTAEGGPGQIAYASSFRVQFWHLKLEMEMR